MAGGPGTVAKVSGLLLGLVFAPFASPIIAWVQGSRAKRGEMTRVAAKSLNKPLLVLGIDRKLVGLAFLLAVTVGANDCGSKLAAVALFLGLCVLGRRLTRKDPNIFLVLN